VGRTEWQEALRGSVARRRSREETRKEIADRYLRMIGAWVSFREKGPHEASPG
jgi:hypothetical protein